METQNCAKRIVIGMQRTTFKTRLKSSEKGVINFFYINLCSNFEFHLLEKTFKCSETH